MWIGAEFSMQYYALSGLDNSEQSEPISGTLLVEAMSRRTRNKCQTLSDTGVKTLFLLEQRCAESYAMPETVAQALCFKSRQLLSKTKSII